MWQNLTFNAKVKMKQRTLPIIGFLSILAVLAAIYTQYFLNMQPCAWCVLQRFIFCVIAIIPFIFEIKASCADSAVNLLGLPYEVFSGGLFLLFILLIIFSWKSKK